MKPILEYRRKPARVAQRKERSLPKRKAASSTPAASANGTITLKLPPKNVVVGVITSVHPKGVGGPIKVGQTVTADEATAAMLILARIREKTRLRVQKHRKNKKGLK